MAHLSGAVAPLIVAAGLVAGCLDLQGSSPTAPPVASEGGGGGTAEPLPPLPGGVRVMSWNVEQFPLEATTPERVASIVEEHAPDVLAMQEISEASAFTALDARLEGYVGVLDDDPGNYLRQGILYRTSRVALGPPTTLFADDGWAFPRRPLSAVVSAPGFDFVLVVLHLKAQVDEQSQSRRVLAIQKLAAWLDDRLAEGGEEDFVVAGDFNDELTDPPADNIFGPLLSDPRFRFLTLDLEAQGGFSYIPFQAFLDHVLVTSDALDEYGEGQTQVLALDVFEPGYDGISDHRPVVVDFVPGS